MYIVAGNHTVEMLRAGEFKPRRDREEWNFSFPIDWEADPFEDRNWRFQLHSWRMTDPFLNEYFRTGDKALLHETLEYILDWHRFHFVLGQSSDYSWYDMAVGIRALRLAFFIDKNRRGYLDLSRDQIAALEEMADAHAEKLQVEEFIGINNHGIFQVAGLNLLCMVIPERESCRDGRAFASRMFTKVMDLQYTAEGVHTENSPSYHFFVGNLLRSFSALEHLDYPIAELRERIDRWRPWFVFPNGLVARIGDSGGSSEPLSTNPAEPACLADRCFAVADLSASGYAIVRSLPSEPQDSMLFVTGMAHNYVHKHADELSFELFEFGRFIFIDSGKYGYNRNKARNYAISASAHNTISLDDEQFSVRSLTLDGSLLLPIAHDDQGFRIEGNLQRADLFDQHRIITYDPGASLRIVDHLIADGARHYVSSLHFAPDLEPRLAGDGFLVSVGDREVRGTLVSDGPCTLAMVRGQNEPRLGWFSPDYLEIVPASVVRAKCSGVELDIEWKITFH